MKALKAILRKWSSSNHAQCRLENYVQSMHFLMGIGSGGGVADSGERVIFDVLKRVAKPPYCIFDVGSNQGQFLELLLQNIGDAETLVHCFEPGVKTFEILYAKYSSKKQIAFNNIGIGKDNADAILHYDNTGSGLASLTRRRLDHFGIQFDQSEIVKIRSIDAYCSEKAINHVHLLKLDIEGHELDALAGARGLFKSNSIDVVTFEFGGCNIDTRTFFQDYWYFFLDAGMTLYRITPTGYLFHIASYKECDEQFRTTNFIAVSNRYESISD